MAKKQGKAVQKPTVLPLRSKEEELEDLLNEFRGRIDEPLIILIHGESDYDAARKALDDIAENVTQEENSGFDPSGLQNEIFSSSAEIVNSSDASSSSQVGSGEIVRRPSSHATTAPSELGSGPLSPSVSPMRGSSDGCLRGTGVSSPVENSDLLSSLRIMFPDLKEFDIKDAIKNGNNDMVTATDLLLNVMHLEATSQRPKGVDGFFAEDNDSKNVHLGSKKHRRNARLKQQKTDQLPVNYKLKPAALDDDEDADSSTSRPQASLSSIMLSEEDQRQNLAQLQHHRESRAQLSEAARALSRRGVFYRQAAAVYIERREQHHTAVGILESRHSDSIIDGQSSGNHIDLHQVSVEDGIRNALARTQIWWSSLGEDRIRKARENPLEIITGAGNHSASRISPMYTRVGRALREAGWKVEDGIGKYTITGKKI